MRISLHGQPSGPPILGGVPFAAGTLPAGAGLTLRDADGREPALWWRVRSRWPDGSARWVFLHAAPAPDTPATSGRGGETPVDASATAGPGAAARRCFELTVVDRAAPPPVALRDGVLLLADTRLEVDAEGGWTVSAGGAGIGLRSSDVDLGAPAGGGDAGGTTARVRLAGPVAVELLEASPIAPLVRIRQILARAASGGTAAPPVVRFDQLLRLTPGGLHWQQRLSFLTDRLHTLVGLTSTLALDRDGSEGAGVDHDRPQGPADRWRFGDLPARRRLSVPRPGRQRFDDGEERSGHPEARAALGDVEVWLERGWQRAPFALTGRGADLLLELYPTDAEPLPVHPGTSFRHSLRIGLGGPAAVPGRLVVDPEAACASGAFGPLVAHTESTRRRFPGFERAMAACVDAGRVTRLDKEPGQAPGPVAGLADEATQDEEYFGLQHDGDWPMALGAYGGQRRMYADNEYDTPFAYWLQFVRTGTPAYADVAAASAVHMADLDCKVTDGDMRFHGYRETADDHGTHRVSHGDLGHYWTDGLMLAWLLDGDLWAREAAHGVARWLCERFAGEGDAPVRAAFLGCERAVGWPLVALAGVAEVEDEAEVDAPLAARMDAMVAYLARFTADPDRELEEADGLGVRWWRICQQDGTKPFMLGVVMEGLERHHRRCQDPAAAQALVAIARFLVDTLWVEGIEAFIYEWNAFNRGHREEVYPHYINMMVAPGLAYAYELTGQKRFREVATRAFHAGLWTLWAPGGGKEIGMVGRTSSVMVARLQAWHEADAAARARRQAPSDGVAFRFAGGAGDLHRDARVFQRAGTPRFEGTALVADADSWSVYSFVDRVSTERGRIALTITPDWDCPAHPGPVAQRAYLHLCGRPFTAACVSLISFYTGLHVRFHDAERHYMEVLETSIAAWRAGQAHRIEIEWDGPAGPAGRACLRLDGRVADERPLDRRLSGAFQYLHLGHRPGGWRAEARLGDLVLELG